MISLIHPPHLNSTDDRLDPPLGLLYLAAHLREKNIDVTVTDLSGIKQEDWKIPYADIYGITVYVTSIKVTKEIIKVCKQINPKAKIVVGGAHPSARPMDFDFVDYVVVGPGESATVNIALGEEHRHIVEGALPNNYFVFPAYDLVDPKSYHRTIAGKVSLPYLTSRNCPFRCAFCGLAKLHKIGPVVKMADSSIVEWQLREIKEKFGIDRIAFQDDVFTLNKNRLVKILDVLKSLNIKFRCMGRAGYDTEEVYQRLADAGCEQVSWGIESGSQYILDRMNKRVKVEDNYNVIQWAKKYGITSRAFFIIGFPGETKATIEETKKFIVDADPDQYFASNFIPYPGTDVGDFPEDYGITKVVNDYDQFYQVSADGTGGMVIDTLWMSKEEFRELELEFRGWLRSRPFRGNVQIYEKDMSKWVKGIS